MKKRVEIKLAKKAMTKVEAGIGPSLKEQQAFVNQMSKGITSLSARWNFFIMNPRSST